VRYCAEQCAYEVRRNRASQVTSPDSRIGAGEATGLSTSDLLLASELAVAAMPFFQQALARVPSEEGLRGRRGAELVDQFVQETLRLGELPERVQAERLQAVLVRLHLADSGLLVVMSKASSWPAGLRNTVAAFLTPEQRRMMGSLTAPWQKSSSTSAVIDRGGADQLGERGSREAGEDPKQGPPQALPVTHEVGQAIQTRDVGPQASRDQTMVAQAQPSSTNHSALQDASTWEWAARAFSVVAILSKLAQQDENKRLLSDQPQAFAPLVWDSVEKLHEDFKQNRDVCACLVDGSVLGELDVTGQSDLFSFLGGYSTFLWIRIDESGLKLAREEVRRLIRLARGSLGDIGGLTWGSSSILSNGEIQDIVATRRTLCAFDEAELRSAELSDDETRLLKAAARHHAQQNHFGSAVVVEYLQAKFIEGGKSGARTARVSVSGTPTQFIAKVHSKGAILDEIRRFRTFVQASDNRLQPQAHFHGDVGVLLFAFIASENSRLQPADGVGKCLENFWNLELFPQEANAEPIEHRKRNLIAGVTNVAQALATLNQQSPNDFSPMQTMVSLSIAHLTRLEENGVRWGLQDSVFSSRARAITVAAKLAQHAIVHGDLHLNNALLRGDREAFLIDYAACGPGHPAIDLARYELALVVSAMRDTSDEAEFVEYQSVLSSGNDTAVQLIARFPDLHRCAINEVCTHGLVAARDAALRVLQHHGGNRQDYLAVKLLVAWQVLAFFGGNRRLARAVIVALAPLI
jgi:hypothetical protein